MDSEVINKALAFAAEKHNGVFRKGTELPYILHPMEVAVIASSMTDDTDVVAAAILHDTIEDTDTEKEDIVREFGENIAYLVCAESEDKREGTPHDESWKIRKYETIVHLRDCTDERVKILTLSDKLANIRAIHRDFQIEGDNFWNRFNQKDPKEQKWYYNSFRYTLASLKDTEAYKEYIGRVDQVFSRY